MAKKLPNITLPRTSDGFTKKLDAMNKAGINTREDAYKYATIMLASINFEMARLEPYKDNPHINGLIVRYQPMRERWERNLEYIRKQLLAE